MTSVEITRQYVRAYERNCTDATAWAVMSLGSNRVQHSIESAINGYGMDQL